MPEPERRTNSSSHVLVARSQGTLAALPLPLRPLFGKCGSQVPTPLSPVIPWTILGRRDESQKGPQAVEQG